MIINIIFYSGIGRIHLHQNGNLINGINEINNINDSQQLGNYNNNQFGNINNNQYRDRGEDGNIQENDEQIVEWNG